MSDRSIFAARHIGPDSPAVATMLAVIGVDSLDELAAKAVPTGILDQLIDGGESIDAPEDELASRRKHRDRKIG